MEILCTISKQLSFEYAYKAVKKNFWSFALLSIIFAIIIALPAFFIRISELTGISDDSASSHIRSFLYLLSFAFTFILLRFNLDVCQNKKFVFSDIKSIFSLTFLRLLGGFFLISLFNVAIIAIFVLPAGVLYYLFVIFLHPYIKLLLVVLYGLALCLLCIYLLARLWYFAYFLIEQNTGIRDAIIHSFKMTKGVPFKNQLRIHASLLFLLISDAVVATLLVLLFMHTLPFWGFILSLVLILFVIGLWIMWLSNVYLSIYHQLLKKNDGA